MRNLLRCSVGAFLLGTALPGAEPPTHFDAAAFSQLVRVAEPQLSPDGRSVLIVVARQNAAQNVWDNSLVRVDVRSGVQTVLTKVHTGLRHPRWSPAGDRVAFLASVPAKAGGAVAQIFVLSAGGGSARMVTTAPRSVQHFAWRPDGRAFAFAMPAATDATKVAGREISFEVTDEDYLASEPATPVEIWQVPASGGESRRLVSGPGSLPAPTSSGPPPSALAWSPDGRMLAFVRRATSRPSDLAGQVVILDPAGGTPRELTSGGGEIVSHPVFSRDGRELAFWSRADGLSRNEVHVVEIASGSRRSATAALDRSVYRALWRGEGKELLLGGMDGTRTALWIQPADGPAQRLELGEVNPSGTYWVEVSNSPDGGIAFVGTTPRRPAELYYLPSVTATPRRLTDFHREIAGRSLGAVETVEWRGEGGIEMTGVLTYPPAYLPGTVCPLVLDLHGGPQASSQAAFRPRAQWLAAQGWLVLEPNYRGGDGGGEALLRGIVGDPVHGPVADILAGLDEVQRRGIVDLRHLAVSGYSYGGFLAAWLAAAHADRGWKCVVAGAPPIDLIDQYCLSDLNVSRRDALGGPPWREENAARYRANSPLSAAAQIRAPVLLLGLTGDVRVPITSSFKFYHALKDQGLPVQFIAYPVGGHAPGDPARQLDLNRRWVEWIAQEFARP